MSLIGAFYYLRAVKVMYFDDVQDHSPITISGDMKLVLSLNAVALLVLGAMPERLIAMCVEAMKQSLVVL
ncbi:NADH:ubiquinone oxidoreductase subunit N [compost metagenome]